MHAENIYWFGQPVLRDSGDTGYAELFSEPLCPEGMPTSAPDAMSLELLLGTPRIPTQNSHTRELQLRGRQHTGVKGTGSPTPTILTSLSTTVDVEGFPMIY